VDALWSLLLGLPGVFVAAFLAMMLENVRERSRTRRWVIRNLQAMVASIQTSPVEVWDTARAAVQRWLDAKSAEDMDEESWRFSRCMITGSGADFAPLLRSEAAISVSGDLFAAVYNLEEQVLAVQLTSSLLNECFTRDVLPLWYERRVPLRDADARRVTSYLGFINAAGVAAGNAREAIERFQEQVRLALPSA
jgi:hypothetical protein